MYTSSDGVLDAAPAQQHRNAEQGVLHQLLPTAPCFDLGKALLHLMSEIEHKKEQGHVLKEGLYPSPWGKAGGVNPGGQCSVQQRASQHLLSKGFSYRLMPFRLSNAMP